MWRRRYFHGINAMILMPQIFDVIAYENARYKRNELDAQLGTKLEVSIFQIQSSDTWQDHKRLV